MANTKQKGSINWIFWMIGIIAIGVIIIVVLDQNMSSSDKEAGADIDYENQPYIGDEDAPVKMIEFGDYRCPHCKNFQQSAFPEIKKQLVDSGDVKFYFINYAFLNKDSEQGAKFAETVFQELGNDVFWEFNDHLFESMPDDMEKSNVYTTDFLKKALQDVVDDQEKVQTVVDAYENGAGEDALEKDMEIARNLGVTGTPTVAVDGEVIKLESFQDLKDAVEEAKNN